MASYPDNLYLLPFDHRSSFIKAFFNNPKQLDAQQKKLIIQYKKYIFDGFLLALGYVKNPADCAIMIDEEFGLDIIKSAQHKNIIVALSTEKSGSKVFSLAYGNQFNKHILKIKPNLVKALVRYNPVNKQVNQTQLKRLKQLHDWCQDNSYKFMLESLIPPTPAQLKRFKNKRELYDAKLKPSLTVKMINEFRQAGIEPDIWKIEAFENQEDWPEIVDLIREKENTREVGIIMLGRGESFAKIKFWMNIAPKHLLNGFAVGRTVFLRPLLDFHHKKITKNQAIKQIAKNYLELVKYWQK